MRTTLRNFKVTQLTEYLQDYYGYDLETIKSKTIAFWVQLIKDNGDSIHFEEFSN
jgi:coenzyme F420-reducing hydrogenase beta subunit